MLLLSQELITKFNVRWLDLIATVSLFCICKYQNSYGIQQIVCDLKCTSLFLKCSPFLDTLKYILRCTCLMFKQRALHVKRTSITRESVTRVHSPFKHKPTAAPVHYVDLNPFITHRPTHNIRGCWKVIWLHQLLSLWQESIPFNGWMASLLQTPSYQVWDGDFE